MVRMTWMISIVMVMAHDRMVMTIMMIKAQERVEVQIQERVGSTQKRLKVLAKETEKMETKNARRVGAEMDPIGMDPRTNTGLIEFVIAVTGGGVGINAEPWCLQHYHRRLCR